MRIHLYQISYAPAYFTENADYLSEPCFLPEQSLSGALRVSQPGRAVLERVRTEYLTHIRRKIQSLLEWSAARGADLVVFPEYAVPAEALEPVVEESSKTKGTIVAASHRVRPASGSGLMSPVASIPAYRSLAGTACAPIFQGGQCIGTAVKQFRSQWEPDLVTAGGRAAWFSLGESRPLRVAVILCIDGLHPEALARLWQGGQGHADVVVCPSLSPRTEVFRSLGPLAATHGAIFLFVNCAQYGGSECSYPDSWTGRLAGPALLSDALLPGAEAVIEFDLNPLSLSTKGPAVGGEPPAQFPSACPIVHLEHAPWLQEFLQTADAIREALRKGETEDASEWLDLFLTERAATLPAVLKWNLEYAKNLIIPGFTGDMTAVDKAMSIACVRGTQELRTIWAAATRDTLDVLTDMIKDPDFDVTPSILQALSALKRAARSLPTPSPSRGEASHAATSSLGRATPATEAVAAELISAFQDRGPILDELHTYMGSSESRVIVVTGPLGMGKTSLVSVLQGKILTDWRVRKVPVVEGSSAAALLSALGAAVGYDLDINALSAASSAVFRRRVRDVMARVYDTPRCMTVVDDLGNIIAGRLPFDYKRLELLVDEAANPADFVGGKLVLVCSAYVPRTWLNRLGVRHVHLGPLSNRYVSRIIERQLRRAGALTGETPPAIPQEVIDLVRGHPLSAIYCAGAMEGTSEAPLTKKQLEKLETSVATELLRHVKLTPEEDRLLQRFAVFRLPVRLDGLRETGFPVDALQTLAERCIVSSDGREVGMHEAARRHFYAKVRDGQLRAESHSTAIDYYRPIHEREKADSQWNPFTAVELCHHLARTGRHLEALSLGVAIVEELKQTGRMLYRRDRRYDDALSLFRLAVQLSPSDVQALAYVGRCFARLHQWKDCDEAFTQAFAAAERKHEPAWWIHRDWGHIKARFGFYGEANQHFDDAEACGVDDASIIASRAYIRWHQGDTAGALEQFERAYRARPDHEYTLKYYADLLDDVGDHRYAAALRQELAIVQAREPGESPSEYEMEDDFSDL